MGKITIKDIALKAGVSYSSVSRALSDSNKISKSTKKRILEICREEGYIVNTIARSLSSRKSHIIGLIVPDISNPFYSEIVQAIELYARKNGYIVIPCSSMNDQNACENLIQLLISQQVSGIIYAGSDPQAIVIAKKYQNQVNIIFLGGSFDLESESPINMVSIDNYIGGKIAGSYLIELSHKNIIFAGFRSSSTTHKHRLSGFINALSDVDAYPVIIENSYLQSSIKSGYEIGKDIFSSRKNETAIFAVSDTIAMGIIKAAEEYNISIPQDYSLIGFDNISYSSLPRIGLTTIDHCKQSIAKAATDMVIELIDKQNQQDGRHVIFKPAIIERTSCTRYV